MINLTSLTVSGFVHKKKTLNWIPFNVYIHIFQWKLEAMRENGQLICLRLRRKNDSRTVLKIFLTSVLTDDVI